MDAIVKAEQNNNYNSAEDEILEGLRAEQKSISPKYFYDHYGSELFSQIMQLPEYYLTRTERKILKANAQEIAQYVGENSILIEPGAGNCEKITYLLEAIHPEAFYPQDISHEFLARTANQLRAQFPWLIVEPISGDFHDEIIIPDSYPEAKRVVFYPGSTIGNFDPTIACAFLKRMKQLVGPEGGFIIGVDLIKDHTILNAAYNDQQGVTAAFNLNILNHLNSLVGANFDINLFEHLAFFNESKSRIEMHLKSLIDQDVLIGNESFTFNHGELIHTENSYKYDLDSFTELVTNAGLALEATWMDDQALFSVHYLSVR